LEGSSAPATSVAKLRVGAIEYLAGSGSIQAAVIDDQGGCRLFPLCRADEYLAEAHELLEALEGPSTPKERERQFQSFSSGWGRKLLPPFEELAGFDVLVLIPHHTLHALPLHAIWIEEANAPLGICRALTYCSSATLFRRCTERNVARRADFAAWIPGDAGRTPVAPPLLPQLCAGIATDALGGKDESYKKLGNHFASYFAAHNGPSMLRLGIKRPYRVNQENPATYDAIYFVCHGYYDPVLPVNTGLVVTNPLSGTTERFIHLPGDRGGFYRDLPFRELPREIVPRKDVSAEMMTIGELQVEGFTQAELAALLGCNTSAGHVLSGDTMQSMAYQWLKLGAASALASLWRLDIEFISEWAGLFLERWLQFRQPKAIAWREALRTMTNIAAPPPAYQWAAIQLMGDWI
jgi:hypothetical protein